MEEAQEKVDGVESKKEGKSDYNEKYKNLILEYKQQILRLNVSPLQIAERLEDQKVITKSDLTYINSLTLPKWQIETLFQFLIKSRCDQLSQVKAALKHYDSDAGTDDLLKIFDEISVRGQHIFRDARDHGVKLTKTEPELPTEIWLPYQLFEAAYEGNVKQLVEVFAHVTSLQMLLNLIENVGKELTGSGVSPLHVACALGGVKADFIRCFTHLVQLLINSDTGSMKTARMLNFKSNQANCAKTTNKTKFVQVRVLEDFLNLKDSWGNTAMHWAARAHATDTCKFLYNKRVDLFIENDQGETPIEILFEISPEVVLYILNDHLPSLMSFTKRERVDDEVSLDMIAVTGQSKGQVETQLLAQMVLGNGLENSSKHILPHVSVKTFLDEKWKKLVAPIFALTTIYILFHLLHTVFLVQVFIVSHPYKANSTGESPGDELAGAGNSKNISQDFYNYLLGNWDSVDSVYSRDTSPLSKDLALASKITATMMLLAETFEIWATALCVSHTRDGLKPRMEQRWTSRRKMDLVILIILSSVYDRDTYRSLVALIALLPLYIYDWIAITSNSREKGKRRFSAFVLSKILKVSINAAIIALSLYTGQNLTNAAYFTISVASICIFLEIVRPMEYIFNKSMEGVATFFSKLGTILRRRFRSTDRLDGRRKSPQEFPLMGVESGKGNEMKMEEEDDDIFETNWHPCGYNLVNFLITFWKGTLAYLTNLENVLQLTYISIIIYVSHSIHESALTKGLYRGAAVAVVLAWILILMQIGHIYGLGKYIHMLRTVVKSFLAVMGIYMSLLVAFSLSFSIVFPNESRFESLPASFFRVVAMMAGELNYDDIFYPENSELAPLSFPYASQWIHLIFVLAVVIVLINLLIGLTVNDIQKIQEKSDVIYRSVQVERLFIMEIFFQSLANFLSFFASLCSRQRRPFHFSTFNVFKSSSTRMLINWNKLSPTLQAEFIQARKDLEENTEQILECDPNPTVTNLTFQILALFEDRDQIEDFPLHWLFALTNEKECQEKICSVAHKDFLPANEFNRDLLDLLTTFCVQLKTLRISLEKCAPSLGDGDILNDCKSSLFKILTQNAQTLLRLEVNWRMLPLLQKIPQFPQLTTLGLIGNNKEEEEHKENGGFLDIQNFYYFQNNFSKVTSLQIVGRLQNEFDFQICFPPYIFRRHKSYRQVKSLLIETDKVIDPQIFEKLRNLFPKINRLEISGGVERMHEKVDVVPSLWPQLTAVQGGELWILSGPEKGSPGSPSQGNSDGLSMSSSGPHHVTDALSDDSVRMPTTSMSDDSGSTRFGSNLASRLKNFWFKSVEEEYPLNGNGMGYILIINNIFDDPDQNENISYINLERPRSVWDDGVKIARLFRDLNFRTRLEKNVTSQELDEILQDFKFECTRYGYHSSFVFLMTHAGQPTQDSLLMDDLVTVDLKEILHSFSDLGQLPKVFFVDTCQFQDDPQEIRSPLRSESLQSRLTNTLLCRSIVSSSKFGAVRGQKEEGNLFVEGIDRIFREKAGTCSLQEMIGMIQLYVHERSGERQGPVVSYMGFNRQYKFEKIKT